MLQAALRVRARGLGRNLLPWVALSVGLFSTGSGAAPQNPNPPEVQAHEGQSHDVKPSFQLHVDRNLVTVRVVVRDTKDRPVGDLRQEDFRLFDDGKPQDILGFTVEAGHPNPASEAAPSAPVSPSNVKLNGKFHKIKVTLNTRKNPTAESFFSITRSLNHYSQFTPQYADNYGGWHNGMD